MFEGPFQETAMGKMPVLKILLVLASALFVLAKADDVCWAAPVVYGPECTSSTSIFGSPGLKVYYSVTQVNTGGTLICCKALGCGPPTSASCSTWGQYSIGCSSSSITAALLWGNNAATPSIQCSGTPTGTSFTWGASTKQALK